MGKASNRMPESMWLTFAPMVEGVHGWTLDKVDQRISPPDVVKGGARSMHAVCSLVSRACFLLQVLWQNCNSTVNVAALFLPASFHCSVARLVDHPGQVGWLVVVIVDKTLRVGAPMCVPWPAPA